MSARAPRALVMGFGPFGAVQHNPAERLARAVHGATCRSGLRVEGAVMDVAWRRCWTQTQALVEALQPELLIGVGVAVGRDQPALELRATNALAADRPDVDGATRALVRADGPASLGATAVLSAAEGLGIVRSTDAGRYVCNAWLYQALDEAPPSLPVAFLHLPNAGLDPAVFLELISESSTWSLS